MSPVERSLLSLLFLIPAAPQVLPHDSSLISPLHALALPRARHLGTRWMVAPSETYRYAIATMGEERYKEFFRLTAVNIAARLIFCFLSVPRWRILCFCCRLTLIIREENRRKATTKKICHFPTAQTRKKDKSKGGWKQRPEERKKITKKTWTLLMAYPLTR